MSKYPRYWKRAIKTLSRKDKVLKGLILKYNDKFLTTRKGFSKYYGRVTKTGGVILLLTGVLIATNQIQVISYYILTIFPFLTTLG